MFLEVYSIMRCGIDPKLNVNCGRALQSATQMNQNESNVVWYTWEIHSRQNLVFGIGNLATNRV